MVRSRTTSTEDQEDPNGAITIVVRMSGGGCEAGMEVAAKLGWSIRSLKETIEREHPAHPAAAAQKLIYGGRMLKDEQLIMDVIHFFEKGVAQTFHLIAAPSMLQATPSRREGATLPSHAQPSSSSAVAAATAAASSPSSFPASPPRSGSVAERTAVPATATASAVHATAPSSPASPWPVAPGGHRSASLPPASPSPYGAAIRTLTHSAYGGAPAPPWWPRQHFASPHPSPHHPAHAHAAHAWTPYYGAGHVTSPPTSPALHPYLRHRVAAAAAAAGGVAVHTPHQHHHQHQRQHHQHAQLYQQVYPALYQHLPNPFVHAYSAGGVPLLASTNGAGAHVPDASAAAAAGGGGGGGGGGAAAAARPACPLPSSPGAVQGAAGATVGAAAQAPPVVAVAQNDDDIDRNGNADGHRNNNAGAANGNGAGAAIAGNDDGDDEWEDPMARPRQQSPWRLFLKYIFFVYLFAQDAPQSRVVVLVVAALLAFLFQIGVLKFPFRRHADDAAAPAAAAAAAAALAAGAAADGGGGGGGNRPAALGDGLLDGIGPEGGGRVGAPAGMETPPLPDARLMAPPSLTQEIVAFFAALFSSLLPGNLTREEHPNAHRRPRPNGPVAAVRN